MHVKLILFAVLVLLSACAFGEGSDVVVLNNGNFDKLVSEGEWLLEFFAPWCGHCKKLAPIYDELATTVKGKHNIAKIDCTEEKELASRFGITGFPTIKFYKDGKLYDYTGQRTVASFVEYLSGEYLKAPNKPLPQKVETPQAAAESKPAASKPIINKPTEAEKDSNVVTLTDANFEDLTSQGVWFLEFYAPWCGHCKRLAPVYEDVATQLKGKVNVGKVDCTAQRSVCSQYEIKGYPTIFYRKGSELREYNGQRTVDGFKQYAEGGWEKVAAHPTPEPISAWKVYLNNLVGQIEELLSLNIWIIVAILITVGLLLGIIVVVMTPAPAPKVIHYQNPNPTHSSTQEEITEEITSKED